MQYFEGIGNHSAAILNMPTGTASVSTKRKILHHGFCHFLPGMQAQPALGEWSNSCSRACYWVRAAVKLSNVWVEEVF
ncbi:MAG: hypothetical protein IPG31_09970 [Nitrosomonas sp.]|nr:hypothetical protein [Nitrosomonas sp.]